MPRHEARLEDGKIDAGLLLLLLTTPRGVTRTQGEIAYVCGCSLQNIQAIERNALKKLKRAFARRGVKGAA